MAHYIGLQGFSEAATRGPGFAAGPSGVIA